MKLLLIQSAQKRPGTSELSELLEAYDEMPREMILEHPLLIKGKCVAESLRGRAAASEMWYDELKAYIANAPKSTPERKTAEEAEAYLDISLADMAQSISTSNGTSVSLTSLIRGYSISIVVGNDIIISYCSAIIKNFC